MEQKVKFGTYSYIVTAGIIILFIVGMVALRDNAEKLLILSIILGGITIAGLYYCPRAVVADESGVTLYRLLSKPKHFAYEDIESVDTYYPSFLGLKLCGCDGYFGFWGYFNDTNIGTFFGYYGSRSYCFSLKLKSGRQYVLGCSNPVTLVTHINSHLKLE